MKPKQQTKEQFITLLENSYKAAKELYAHSQSANSKLAYLSHFIFDFLTPDRDLDVHFATEAVKTINALNTQTVSTYIKDKRSLIWFTIMGHMSFFIDKFAYTDAFESAWWEGNFEQGQMQPIEFQSVGLWDGDNQLTDKLQFDQQTWLAFMSAIVDFAAEEMTTTTETTPLIP